MVLTDGLPRASVLRGLAGLVSSALVAGFLIATAGEAQAAPRGALTQNDVVSAAEDAPGAIEPNTADQPRILLPDSDITATSSMSGMGADATPRATLVRAGDLPPGAAATGALGVIDEPSAEAASPVADDTRTESSLEPEIVPGSFVVQVDADASLRDRAKAVERTGAEVQARLGALDMMVVSADDITDLEGLRGIAAVWPDQVVRLDAVQDSPPWGLDRIDQPSLPLDGTFRYDSAGAGVDAYIVDSGIAATHVDFDGRVLTGRDFSGQGRADVDCNSHGTHVAGTVGGRTYGVAKSVTLIPVRVFGCDASTSTAIIVEAVNWIIQSHETGDPAVANFSLGGGAYAPLDTAIGELVADGVVTVVAAGNESINACTVSPARAPEAITVGAVDSQDARASFSNWGRCVDVWAPGVDVESAYSLSLPDGSVRLNGTSMAAPHVAGVAARILSANPRLTPPDVAALISGSATGDIPVVQSSLHEGATAPAAPVGLAATGRSDAVDLNWSAAPDDVDAWALRIGSDPVRYLPRATTAFAVEGLANGVATTFELRGLSVAGLGPAAVVRGSARDTGAPGRPTITRVGSGEEWLTLEVDLGSERSGGRASTVIVEAASPDADSVVSRYQVQAGGLAQVRVDGLVNQATYEIRVRSVNDAGAGSWSAVTEVKPGASVPVGTLDATVFWTDIGGVYAPPGIAPSLALDSVRGIAWMSAGRKVVAMDVRTRLTSEITLTGASNYRLLVDQQTGRTLAVPFNSQGAIRELTLAANSITSAEVATSPANPWTSAFDQDRRELFIGGNTLARVDTTGSGSLRSLPVPALPTGRITGIAIHGPRVVLSSFTAGWVVIWDRDTGRVTRSADMPLTGGILANDAGILVGSVSTSRITSIGWDGSVRGSVDLHVPRHVPGLPYRDRLSVPDLHDLDGTHALVWMNGALVSLRQDTLEVVASGSASGLAEEGPSPLGDGPDATLLASYWLSDVTADLSSTWSGYSPGSRASNGALAAYRGDDVAVVAVRESRGIGLRLHEGIEAPRNVRVDARGAAAEVTWDSPRVMQDGSPDSWRSFARMRPISYDLVVQPSGTSGEGGRVVPWTGGPLSASLSGLDPGTSYLVTVRSHSAGGVTPSETVTFTPAMVPGIPDAPAQVTARAVRDGCLAVTWTPSSGATAYRVTAVGSTQTVSVSGAETTAELCDLRPGPGRMPRVRVQVSSQGSGGWSLPSQPSDPVMPSPLVSIEGIPVDAETHPSSETLAVLTDSATALTWQGRTRWLHLQDAESVRRVAVPSAFMRIIGFANESVLLGSCSVRPGLLRVALDTLEISSVSLPAGTWDTCNAAYSSDLDAVWISSGFWSVEENPFRPGGGRVIAVSLDPNGGVVRETRIACREDSWGDGQVWVRGSPRLETFGSRTLISCASKNDGSSVKMTDFWTFDASSGGELLHTDTWHRPAGMLRDGRLVLIDDRGMTIGEGAGRQRKEFAEDLGHGRSVLGMPLGDESPLYPSVVDVIDDVVLARASHAQLQRWTPKGLMTSLRYLTYGSWFAPAGDGVLQASGEDIHLVGVGGAWRTSSPASLGDPKPEAYRGVRLPLMGRSYLPSPVHPHEDGDISLMGMVMSPDNAGEPTDEEFHTFLWQLGAPAPPLVTTVGDDALTWSPGVGDVQPRDEHLLPLQPVTASDYVVRDGSGAVVCEGAATTCSGRGRFIGGGSISARQRLLGAGSESESVPVLAPLRLMASGLTASTGEVTNQSLRVSDGQESTGWSLAWGDLPPGLELSADGVISGIATQTGSWTVGVRMQRTGGQATIAPLSVRVMDPFRVRIPQVSRWEIGRFYQETLSHTGAEGDVAWSVAGGSLPRGVTLSPTGILAGTPLEAGTWNVVVSARDGAGRVAQDVLVLTVDAPLAITTTSLPDSDIGARLRHQLIATGGVGPLVWEAVSLPQGFAVSSDGYISGTPRTPGRTMIIVRVSDSRGRTAEARVSLRVYTALTARSADLPGAKVGRLYSARLVSQGGVGVVKWTVVSGRIPQGLRFTGYATISGTPARMGTWNFTVRGTDGIGRTVTRSVTITVR